MFRCAFIWNLNFDRSISSLLIDLNTSRLVPSSRRGRDDLDFTE